MAIAQNRGYVKWGKRQLQEVRNAVFSPSLKAISYPSLEVIKGAGHMPTLEQPGETIYALMRWLEDENG